jgi:hypothetical protein
MVWFDYWEYLAVSGVSGYSGYSGKSGYSGYSGAGTSGYSGYSGAVSASGYSGYSGTGGAGSSGYSGYSGAAGAGGTRSFGIIIGGGGVITTGIKGYLSMPNAGTISKVRLLADQSGSIVIDIWKDTYANYPPTVADTITASAQPTLSSATKNEDSTLTGWSKSFSAGDCFAFNVDSASTVTQVTLIVEYT